MPTVSTRYDIKSLIERYTSIRIVSHAFVAGIEEFHSDCPWCGGHDRFVTRPETGQYSCAIRSSGCGRSGDGIDFLREYANMTYQEAVEELALEHVQFADQKPAARRNSRNSSSDAAPSAKWQESAELILARAERYLWLPKPDARKALNYLRDRGLKDETIQKARLGCVPLRADGSWHQESFEAWGLDPEKLTSKQREKGGVRVPDGILMGYMVGGRIWKLEMKRPWAETMPKGQVLGSVDALYNVDALQYGDIAMMTESVIDCLSVQQEAGDLVACVATGSADKGRSRWFAELSIARFVLQSFGSDVAGDAGAEFWMQALLRIERWATVLWNDQNDLLQAQLKNETGGFTLRQWVELGVQLAKPPARDQDMRADIDAHTVDVLGVKVFVPEDLEPSPEEARLETFASAVSAIVDVFGGPDAVQIQRHDGSTLEQHVRATAVYAPVTLPPLPRARCPHGTITLKRVSDEMSRATPGTTCKGKPLGNGWCEYHTSSHELLALGARLGYPEVYLGARSILAGIENWEAYAEKASPPHLRRILPSLKHGMACRGININ